MSEPMNRRDRDQLAQVAKMRARIAKASIAQRELDLDAQVEEELGKLREAETAAMEKGMEFAAALCNRANEELVERLDEWGIPVTLRPKIGVADPRRNDTGGLRRVEMRRIAGAKIRARGAAAKVEIDRQCADVVTTLIAGGLSGEEAERFLASIPSVDQLMLAPTVAELESALDEQRQGRRQLERGW